MGGEKSRKERAGAESYSTQRTAKNRTCRQKSREERQQRQGKAGLLQVGKGRGRRWREQGRGGESRRAGGGGEGGPKKTRGSRRQSLRQGLHVALDGSWCGNQVQKLPDSRCVPRHGTIQWRCEPSRHENEKANGSHDGCAHTRMRQILPKGCR